MAIAIEEASPPGRGVITSPPFWVASTACASEQLYFGYEASPPERGDRLTITKKPLKCGFSAQNIRISLA